MVNHIGLIHAKLVHEIESSIKDDLAHTILHNHPINSIYVLSALYEKGEQKASELAIAIGAAATSFTPILDRLEGAGLVERVPHPQDRRAVLVRLTKEGKRQQTVVENAIGNAEVRYGGK